MFITVLRLLTWKFDSTAKTGPGPMRHCGADSVAAVNSTASGPVSPVRMRITCSTSRTKILPSPILPVRAALMIASTTCSAIASSTTTSIFTLGRKSTTYSAPRYSSVWPFWRPKPFTSVTVRPVTPTSASASRTSSSLNGLITQVICFMLVSRCRFIALIRHYCSIGHPRQIPAQLLAGPRLVRLHPHRRLPSRSARASRRAATASRRSRPSARSARRSA